MKIRYALASLLVLGSLASSAFAQGESPDKPYGSGTWVFTTPSGQVMRRTLTPAMTAELTKDATPMTVGTMMVMHDGKMYIVLDKKMANGKMMSDMALGK